LVALIRKNDGARLQTQVNDHRLRFQSAITDTEERKAFVGLLARFVRSYHFLTAFFSYAKPVIEFAAFCEYVGPQLIKAGTVSDLMKQIRASGGGALVKTISVQDMIARIRVQFEISEDEALHIREVSEEKIADESVQQTVAAHRVDLGFLNTTYREQINSDIQDAYALRQLYEQLADPKYTDKTGIFDFMALTVIQTGLDLADAS
jgi:type I restriction enzyme R subunit